MADFRIRAGSVIGRDHLLMGRNSQDAFKTKIIESQSGDVYMGVVSDGCGSMEHSEVGSQLLADFVINNLITQMTKRILWEARVSSLCKAIVRFLTKLTSCWCKESRSQLLENYFLATILGFVSDGEKVVIFFRGDGSIFIENDCLIIDQDNQPDYLVYDLFGQKNGDFSTIEVDLENVSKIAIATDGFEPELISEFWDREHPNSTQRLLNVYSGKKHFQDDATLVIFEKIQPKGGEENED